MRKRGSNTPPTPTVPPWCETPILHLPGVWIIEGSHMCQLVKLDHQLWAPGSSVGPRVAPGPPGWGGVQAKQARSISNHTALLQCAWLEKLLCKCVLQCVFVFFTIFFLIKGEIIYVFISKITWSHEVCEIARFFPLFLQSFVASLSYLSWSLCPQLCSSVQSHRTATTSYTHPQKAPGFSTKKLWKPAK